jgi:hypothetical protein
MMEGKQLVLFWVRYKLPGSDGDENNRALFRELTTGRPTCHPTYQFIRAQTVTLIYISIFFIHNIDRRGRLQYPNRYAEQVIVWDRRLRMDEASHRRSQVWKRVRQNKRAAVWLITRLTQLPQESFVYFPFRSFQRGSCWSMDLVRIISPWVRKLHECLILYTKCHNPIYITDNFGQWCIRLICSREFRYADHSDCPVKHCDRWFESHLRHGCLCVIFLCLCCPVCR